MKNWSNYFFTEAECVNRIFKALPIIKDNGGFTTIDNYKYTYLGKKKILEYDKLLHKLTVALYENDSSMNIVLNAPYILALSDEGIVKYIRVPNKSLDYNTMGELHIYRGDNHFKVENNKNDLIHPRKIELVKHPNIIPKEVLASEEKFREYSLNLMPKGLNEFLESQSIINNVDHIKELYKGYELSEIYNVIRAAKINSILI